MMKHAPSGRTLFNVFLLGLGLFAIYKSSALPLGSLHEPDAGLFPLATAIALAVLATTTLAMRERSHVVDSLHEVRMSHVVIMIVAIGAYAWLLPRAGFLICTVALLVLTLRALGRVGWLGTVASSVIGAAACYFLFTGLGLPLPAGWLG